MEQKIYIDLIENKIHSRKLAVQKGALIDCFSVYLLNVITEYVLSKHIVKLDNLLQFLKLLKDGFLNKITSTMICLYLYNMFIISTLTPSKLLSLKKIVWCYFNIGVTEK